MTNAHGVLKRVLKINEEQGLELATLIPEMEQTHEKLMIDVNRLATNLATEKYHRIPSISESQREKSTGSGKTQKMFNHFPEIDSRVSSGVGSTQNSLHSATERLSLSPPASTDFSAEWKN